MQFWKTSLSSSLVKCLLLVQEVLCSDPCHDIPMSRAVHCLKLRLIIEPRHEKTCFNHMQTTKVQLSLRISTFAVLYLDSIIQLASISKISRLLSCLCSWAGRFESYLVANPKDKLSCDEALMVALRLVSCVEGLYGWVEYHVWCMGRDISESERYETELWASTTSTLLATSFRLWKTFMQILSHEYLVLSLSSNLPQNFENWFTNKFNVQK